MKRAADHVRLLARTWPDDQLSDVVQAFKGGTSRALRQEFGHLDGFRWKAGLWGRGFLDRDTLGLQRVRSHL